MSTEDNEDRTFIHNRAQNDERVWPLTVALARAIVKIADEKDGDGVGDLYLYVTEGHGPDKATTRYIDITLVMPAGPVDAALAKAGVIPGPAEDATAQRFAAMELE